LKTTKAHFEYFKSEVLRWVEKLGVTDYRIDFIHADIDEYASFFVAARKKVSSVMFCTDWFVEERPLNKANIADTAKHEAVHVVLADLSWLARDRFTTEGEVLAATEAAARRIQRLL